ncbi:hypothetical protein AGMMS49944_13500 [Spirochaetia bacterium]|nr:hypothetical protein AGMMS49944_13500 [Spirochaetia bacterium]
MIKKPFIVIFSFFYVFSIRLFFMPLSFYMLCGLFVAPYLIAKKSLCQNYYIPRRIANSTYILLLLLLTSFVAIVYNSTSETINRSFVVYIIAPFSAFVFVRIINMNFKKVNFKIIADLYIIAADIQILLIVVFVFNPSFRDFALGFLRISDLSQETMENTIQFRLFGFGVFGAQVGMLFSFILILISILLKDHRLKFMEYVFYVISFFLIFGIGMMCSRSTSVGFVLSILILFEFKRKILREKLFLIIILLIFISIFLGILFSIANKTNNNIGTYLDFGFRLLRKKELMRNYNGYIAMQKFPDSIKTWIIGDGQWVNPLHPTKAFYMGTDAGYSRLLYYFGLIGTILFIFINCYITHYASNKNKTFFYSMLLLFFIMNLKQYQSYIILMYPFCFISNRYNN